MNHQNRWLDQINSANMNFYTSIDPAKLPVTRSPGPAVITCMDPRVNLEAIGIPGFTHEGEGLSPVRIIRTLGGMAENRSLIVGIYLAGIREIALVMHTDCGCCLAFSKVDTVIENMYSQLSNGAFSTFRAEIGEPFRENLRTYLKAFEDPYLAVQMEIESIRKFIVYPQ